MLRIGVPHTTAWTRGRRGAVTAASAAVVVLGAVVAACGGDGPGDGYTAVGAGRGGPTAVAPTEPVTLVPLDGPAAGGASGGEAPHASDPVARAQGPAARTRGPAGRASTGAPTSRGGTASPHGTAPGAPGTSGGQDGRRTTPPPPADSAPPAATPSRPGPPGSPAPGRTTPAALSWGEPVAEGTSRRWCQEVTVAFHNSGGTAVRSGSVTFGTHIVGALGVDWGTVESTVPLPVPLTPGARKSPVWTVCVDAWRVPLGMRIETREVSVDWE
ncbi:hypothetical protein [Streptomyces rubradiris]|uniref:Secreted protein n=1 Tax=Streptomyces rubradiris TaxID=285531 RepID=A0ABQ3RLN1_STRRR|nr:hypothetical protein [Streptomyces rubradiris]GHH09773.1 hypothetical protein GCM10018792_32640 [Streptomyces rubradiris]GHI56771.1 hypothetical protein Srubr_66170 [Streptomyces rubradiris]